MNDFHGEKVVLEHHFRLQRMGFVGWTTEEMSLSSLMTFFVKEVVNLDSRN